MELQKINFGPARILRSLLFNWKLNSEIVYNSNSFLIMLRLWRIVNIKIKKSKGPIVGFFPVKKTVSCFFNC